MAADRVQSAALTQAAFRIANERMARWDERHRDGAQELYLCECAQACREHLWLTREQYEAVRGDVQHFLVVPGHVCADLECVVQSFSSYEVIEKPRDLTGAAGRDQPATGAPRRRDRRRARDRRMEERRAPAGRSPRA